MHTLRLHHPGRAAVWSWLPCWNSLGYGQKFEFNFSALLIWGAGKFKLECGFPGETWWDQMFSLEVEFLCLIGFINHLLENKNSWRDRTSFLCLCALRAVTLLLFHLTPLTTLTVWLTWYYPGLLILYSICALYLFLKPFFLRVQH